MADNWYNSYTKIQAFGKVLYHAKVIENIDDLFGYLGRPIEYDEAYHYWVELGSPEPRDREWNRFVSSLVVQVEEPVDE